MPDFWANWRGIYHEPYTNAVSKLRGSTFLIPEDVKRFMYHKDGISARKRYFTTVEMHIHSLAPSANTVLGSKQLLNESSVLETRCCTQCSKFYEVISSVE